MSTMTISRSSQPRPCAAAPAALFKPAARFKPAALSRPAALPALAAALLALAGCAPAGPPPPPDSPAYYPRVVQPILRENCYRCHAGLNHKGDLRLDTPQAILHGGKTGAVIVPGHPESSLLITLIRHEQKTDPPGPMPPKDRDRLSQADIAAITAWVQAGAKMPE